MDILIARKSWLIKSLEICIILSIVIGVIPSAQAQGSLPGWTIPQQIPGYLDDTFTPLLISDNNRTVHAFANQWVGENDRQPAIYYRKWSISGGWSSPVDIIIWEDGEVIIQGAYLDKNGILHIIFWGGKDEIGNLYYSHAPVSLADRAPVWSEPKMIGPDAIYPSSAKLYGVGQGNLIAIYSSRVDKNGVYSIHSANSGKSWSEPVPVYFTEDLGYIPYSIQMTTDGSNRIHAVWNIVDSTGNDLALFYSRYQPDSDTWREAYLLDKRINQKDYFGPSFPTISISENKIVVFYNSGNPSSGYVGIGRPVQMVRVSDDGGDTWSEASQPFPLLQGRSGEHTLAEDSNGVIHAMFIQRIDRTINGQYSPIGGIWHSEYRNNNWTEPERISIPFAAHDIHSVVSQGNVLLATWRADPGVGALGVYYTYKLLDAPELPVELVPTLTVNSGEMSDEVITSPLSTLPGGSQSITGVSINWVEGAPIRKPLNPNIFLAIGAGPVIVLTVALFLIRRLTH